MATRLRARGAALIALIATALALPAVPVAGAPAPISILSVSAENVKPGDTVRLRVRVTNTGNRTETAIVVIGGGLRCATGCRAEPSLKPGQSFDLEATLVAPTVSPNVTTGLNISAAVRLGEQNSFDHKMVYVHGPGTSSPDAEEPSTDVVRVAGRVRDSDGKAVGGAALTVRDSAGHEYRTTSDRSGRFSIKSSAGKPIAAGPITIIVALDGYRTTRATVTGTAGDTASTLVTLAAVAPPTRTPPSPEAAASSTPAADEASEPETSEAAAVPPAVKAVSDESSSFLLFTILGGLLIAGGMGALALVIRRRRAPN
ncbi:carboxypeptidase regulatory-like domain-containing protein [Melissospora conviva]|uniref:carboxypeptidase regulatory-like domain-containing protein n=1 Tax=Melissospora conviva TaxID=3388432 RepID=UPI003B80E8C6